MYNLLQGLIYKNDYYIIQSLNCNRIQSDFICIYQSNYNDIHIYLEEGILHTNGFYYEDFKHQYNKCSYDMLLNVIDLVTKSPGLWHVEVLEFLNSILINWDVG